MSSDFDPWALAATGGQLQRTLSAVELPRVTREVTRILSPVQVELAGATDTAGQATLKGRLRASLEVVCQRCLGPMKVEIRVEPKLALLESELDLETLSDDCDPLVAVRGTSLSLPELVSDELLLALPLAPAHDLGSSDSIGCLSAEARETYYGVGDQRQRPFADLARLLNSKLTQLEE